MSTKTELYKLHKDRIYYRDVMDCIRFTGVPDKTGHRMYITHTFSSLKSFLHLVL